MGGYGGFVWSAYAITFVVLAANLIFTNMSHKRMIAKLRRERAIDSASSKVSQASHAADESTRSAQQGDVI